MLDSRMRELRGSNKMVAPDRLAILTALNLAHELQQREAVGTTRDDDALFKLVDAANARLDGLLAQGS